MGKNEHEELDVYIIPPNFIESGKIFGGMFKLRNAIEAGLLAGLAIFLVWKINVSLTTKIIILCVTALPLGIFGIMGIEGESLTEFVINVFRFLKKRRVLCRSDINDFERVSKLRLKIKKIRFLDASIGKIIDHQKKKKIIKKNKLKEAASKGKKLKEPVDIESYLPIDKIEKGVIFTKDGRYLKILEIEPINFLLRSAREQRNIIFSFVRYLKISPVKIQFKVLTKKADLNKHLKQVNEEMHQETDERCKMQQIDYIRFIKQIGLKEAVSRRFFLIFEYEPFMPNRRGDLNEMYSTLKTAERSAMNYLLQCGNNIVEHQNDDEFMVDVLYSLLNRSSDETLQERVSRILEGEENNEVNINNFIIKIF